MSPKKKLKRYYCEFYLNIGYCVGGLGGLVEAGEVVVVILVVVVSVVVDVVAGVVETNIPT